MSFSLRVFIFNDLFLWSERLYLPGYNCEDKNPCLKTELSPGKDLFPHEVPGKYIQCAALWRCFVRNCPDALIFDPTSNRCDWPAQ